MTCAPSSPYRMEKCAWFRRSHLCDSHARRQTNCPPGSSPNTEREFDELCNPGSHSRFGKSRRPWHRTKPRPSRNTGSLRPWRLVGTCLQLLVLPRSASSEHRERLVGEEPCPTVG